MTVAPLRLAGTHLDSTDLVGRPRQLGGYELRVTGGSRRVVICVGRRFYETDLPDLGRMELEEHHGEALQALALAADHTAVFAR